ncbi:MAG: hypothetical protein SPI15_12270, partial [Candidatus Faecousia sp.]|nr:hypothetical protein [Candidatus Faecousia sp.]
LNSAVRQIGVWRAVPQLPVIANQRARWCGNPPDEWDQVTITTKKREFFCNCGYLSQHCTSNRGIATPVCALARNDRKNVQTTICQLADESR